MTAVTEGSGVTGRVVAVVEDERTIRDAVTVALEREGFGVDAHGDGAAAWVAFQRALPDLVILDIVVPGLDGLQLCRNLRTVSAATPIIFLTSRDEEFDRVLGLELGADDYLCKPFSMRELIARVRVLFRRVDLGRGATQEEQLVCGSLALDLARYLATWRQQPLSLTVTEFRVLEALVREPGKVRSRTALMQLAYPHDTYVSDRTIDTHVKRLRRKLAAGDSDAEVIQTVHGVGYRLNPQLP